MKNWFAIIMVFSGTVLFAQSANNRIAIVDMDFILKKVPEYQEANKELQKRAAEWDAEIQKRKAEIKKLKDQLSVERPLLTSQLVEEKEEEIKLMEAELLSYQQSKFGMDGDYFVQKINLAKPIQDKVFTLVNEYAEKKRYSMVLDKSDETKGMLYAKKGTDISDQIIRELEKTYRRSKLSKKEIAALDAQEKAQELKDRQRTKREELEERQRMIEQENGLVSGNQKEMDPRQAEAQKRIEEAKRKKEELRQQRLKQIEERKAEMAKKREEIRLKREQLLKEAEERKQKAREDRLKRIEEAKKAAGENSAGNSTENKINELKQQQEAAKKAAEDKRKEQQEQKLKEIEDKKKEIQAAAEQRKQKEEERKQQQQDTLNNK